MDTLDTHAWLADHGDYLFRKARRQLHSDELAEDAVQETLLAAISAQARYAGNASPRTWLTGILKHKSSTRSGGSCAKSSCRATRTARKPSTACSSRTAIGSSRHARGAARTPRPNSASCGACWTIAPTA